MFRFIADHVISFEGRSQSALQKAIEFLSTLLADGPLAQQDIEEQYSNEGHSESTIRRAKNALKINSKKKGGPLGDGEQEWFWSLPTPTNKKND